MLVPMPAENTSVSTPPSTAANAPIAVDDAAFIDTSFPGFTALMDGIGARLTPA